MVITIIVGTNIETGSGNTEKSPRKRQRRTKIKEQDVINIVEEPVAKSGLQGTSENRLATTENEAIGNATQGKLMHSILNHQTFKINQQFLTFKLMQSDVKEPVAESRCSNLLLMDNTYTH